MSFHWLEEQFSLISLRSVFKLFWINDLPGPSALSWSYCSWIVPFQSQFKTIRMAIIVKPCQFTSQNVGKVHSAKLAKFFPRTREGSPVFPMDPMDKTGAINHSTTPLWGFLRTAKLRLCLEPQKSHGLAWILPSNNCKQKLPFACKLKSWVAPLIHFRASNPAG